MDAGWFDRMADDARARPEVYQRLGFADLRLMVEESDGDAARQFGLVLDGYDVLAAGEIHDVASFDPEATLTGPRATWDELAANIAANGGADGAHTLNALSIAEAPLRVTSSDPVGRDKFYRYAETLQTLFDAALAPIGV
jgi:hypothetical protein